jgi:hypothetical protein
VVGGRETNAVAKPLQGRMEAGEKAHAPREHGGNAAEVTADDLPGEEGAPMGRTRKGSEKVADLFVALRWKGD